MDSEAQFLLVRREGVTADNFRAALARLAEQAADSGLSAEMVALVPAAALSQLPHVAESTSGDRAADGILTVAGGRSALLDFIAAHAGDIAAICTAAASTAIGVQRNSVLPGGDPVRLFFGLRRLPRLSRAEFQEYWRNVHADFGRRLIPPYSYHQLHADAGLTEAVAQAAGLPASSYDGIVEVHFPDVDALVRQLMRQDVAEEALVDERNFIDHSRSAFFAYQSV